MMMMVLTEDDHLFWHIIVDVSCHHLAISSQHLLWSSLISTCCSWTSTTELSPLQLFFLTFLLTEKYCQSAQLLRGTVKHSPSTLGHRTNSNICPMSGVRECGSLLHRQHQRAIIAANGSRSERLTPNADEAILGTTTNFNCWLPTNCRVNITASWWWPFSSRHLTLTNIDQCHRLLKSNFDTSLSFRCSSALAGCQWSLLVLAQASLCNLSVNSIGKVRQSHPRS